MAQRQLPGRTRVLHRKVNGPVYIWTIPAQNAIISRGGDLQRDRVAARQLVDELRRTQLVTVTSSGDQPLMPGGGISKRPLHFIIAADCSGSMTGEKIQALNYAVADMLPHLAEWERTQEQARVLVRAVSFGEEVRWHVAEPTPVGTLRWPPLRAKGPTPMGEALATIAAALAPGQFERRALRPAILLITDGRPTDKDDGFDRGLGALMATAAGRAALRLALAIGDDAVHDPLDRFIGDRQACRSWWPTAPRRSPTA